MPPSNPSALDPIIYFWQFINASTYLFAYLIIALLLQSVKILLQSTDYYDKELALAFRPWHNKT